MEVLGLKSPDTLLPALHPVKESVWVPGLGPLFLSEISYLLLDKHNRLSQTVLFEEPIHCQGSKPVLVTHRGQLSAAINVHYVACNLKRLFARQENDRFRNFFFLRLSHPRLT